MIMFKGASYVFLGSLLSVSGLFSAVPTSTNFTLKAYDFGSGGGSSSSTSYKLDANAGAQGAGGLTSTNYRSINGELVTQNTSVPAAPTLSNPNNYYVALQIEALL